MTVFLWWISGSFLKWSVYLTGDQTTCPVLSVLTWWIFATILYAMHLISEVSVPQNTKAILSVVPCFLSCFGIHMLQIVSHKVYNVVILFSEMLIFFLLFFFLKFFVLTVSKKFGGAKLLQKKGLKKNYQKIENFKWYWSILFCLLHISNYFFKVFHEQYKR